MRILLVDDQSKIRSALRLLLEQEEGMTVVGEVAKAEDLLAQAEATWPDVVLLDWELPGIRMADLARLRARCPHLRVIALSGKYFVNRKAVRSSKASYDRSAAERLWQVSEAMCGLSRFASGSM
jgi:DNA-binding NarL/FixJ family response regulator